MRDVRDHATKLTLSTVLTNQQNTNNSGEGIAILSVGCCVCVHMCIWLVIQCET